MDNEIQEKYLYTCKTAHIIYKHTYNIQVFMYK